MDQLLDYVTVVNIGALENVGLFPQRQIIAVVKHKCFCLY